MVEIIESDISCGVKQLFNLNDSPLKMITRIVLEFEEAEPAHWESWSFLVFSDNVSKTYQHGRRFAEYLNKHGLGPVTASTIRQNANYRNNDHSGQRPEDHRIQVWVWSFHYDKLRQHLANSEEVVNWWNS